MAYKAITKNIKDLQLELNGITQKEAEATREANKVISKQEEMQHLEDELKNLSIDPSIAKQGIKNK